MNVTICIGSYGEEHWKRLARSRALPSAEAQYAEVLIGHQPDGNVASCRNDLAERATGDWLLFLDADDELGPGYVEAMRKMYATRGSSRRLLLTPKVVKFVHGRPGQPFFHKGRAIDLIYFNWMVIGTLIQRDLFMEIGGFQNYPHGLEDWAVWTTAYREGADVLKVPQARYHWHYNTRSKHAKLMRTPEHAYWHRKVGSMIWPAHFVAPTAEEDSRCRLLSAPGVRPR